MCIEKVCGRLKNRLRTAEDAAALIEPNMTVAFSGFTRAGYPKVVPAAIAALGKAKNLTVITGASTGPELDGALAEAEMIARRIPFQTDSQVRQQINSGRLQFVDVHLGQMPQQMHLGFYGKIDYAIIECSDITDDGVILTTSVGASDTMLACAEHIILEVNEYYHQRLEGLHDILEEKPYPEKREIPIFNAADRVGTVYVPCDFERVEAVVLTNQPDAAVRFSRPDETSQKIAGHILKFLEEQKRTGRLPERLMPLQSGVGSVANAVLAGMADSPLSHLQMYTEVIQDAALRLIRMGKIEYASSTALSLSEEGRAEFMENLDFYRQHLVLRPQNISNHPEVIRRLGVIAMNTAVECDIFGNVNSANVLGSQLISGIGGSADFAGNAALTIFSTPSIAKNGKVSAIVPMVSHVDHPEHDVHVIVTEQGLADLRGKSARERAECIIENCCHPMYRAELQAYYQRAVMVSYGQNMPVDLEKALSWHSHFQKTGTMMQTTGSDLDV